MKELSETKKTILETFKAFASFCEKHNLTYFASAGTCLGAIRHKGFIPWDDDIDVSMPRNDYNRFIELRTELNGTGYNIVTFGDASSEAGIYTTPFSKFCNSNTTIWERRAHPCIFGVFVDVFPYDEVGDKNVAKSLFNQYHDAIGRYYISTRNWSLSDFQNAIAKCNPRSMCRLLYNILVRGNRQEYYKNEILKIDKEIQQQKGDSYLCYCGFYKFEKETMPKIFFGQGVKVPFEDTEIVVPEKYELFLEHLFKDWRTPPPINQRVTHHYCYFEDLTRRWTIDEVKELHLPEEKEIEYTYE